jgi:hypothetical protein
MPFKAERSNLRTIKKGDPKFMLTDGLIVAPRAGFEISQSCPAEYKSIFITAINAGWIKPIATVKDSELFWEEFSK